MGYRYDEDTGQRYYYDDESGDITPVIQSGDDWITVGSPEYERLNYKAPDYYSYEGAAKNYSSGKIPWNYTSLYGDTGYGSTEGQGGLSSREAFNLNALWGGTQYAQGRVTDFSHLDPSQIEANQIAGKTRDELWAVYDQLKAQGKAPEKNPDQMALDFYVNNVGPQGNQFGYGPGANTVLVTEALKNQFLNQPSVVAATGSTYQTPPETLQYAQEFGVARQVGVPTWQVFEQQGYSKDWLGKLVPMIIGSMAFPGLSAGLGGGALGAAGAGALIGGTTAEIGGGDFLKGAFTGALGGGLTSGLSGASTALQEAGISKALADAAVSAGARAISAGATGGDVEQAILGSLVGSGVGGAFGETGIDPSLAKVITPVVTTALLGGDIEGALIKSGLSALKDSSWGANERIPTGGDAEAQEGGFYGIPSYDDSYDPLPMGYENREQVAAENPDLYLDGVLPESGYMTVYNPDGTIEYVPQTPVDVAATSGSNLGGAGSASGGATGTAAAGGVNYGALGRQIQNIFNTQEPNYPSPIKPYLSPNMLVGQIDKSSQQTPDYAQIIGALANIGGRKMKDGGSTHVPGPEGKLYEKHYERGFAVGGPGTGQSDDIPTMLSDSEYVIDADTVAALGDGSSKAGAEVLDKFREEIRRHKRSAPADRIPPKAKNPMAYLKAAKKAKG